ncbi:19569_t:CDS:1 [Funneliformis geosporum]|uniref:219_t:CDS:1 n=1 Tax=Funneliformis geosporum TaxID=1117311 RepID=A0A9W4X035_9GLOM|nr:19569_t:CDS:1 [Funneliformis geosporum]CAI2185267.1 219_t:CDS:1 [Funneliformis geosporum]
MSQMTDSSSLDFEELSPSCVFINTNNPKVQNNVRKDNVPYPSIKPPFPPLLDPKDLLIIGKDNKPTRSPNAFIIYRKVFFKTVRNEGHVLPMTAISSMASQSWEREPEEVKKYYKKLAKEAYNYRNERFPKKSSRRKKRETWNIITFNNNITFSTPSPSPTVNNNNDNVSKDTSENSSNLQSPNPVEYALDAYMQLNTVLLQNIIMSNELSLNLLNNYDAQANILTSAMNLQQIPSLDDHNPDDLLTNHLFENAELSNFHEQIYPNPSLDDINDITDKNDFFPIGNLQLENEQEIEFQKLFIDDDLQQQLLFLPFENSNFFSNKPQQIDLNHSDATPDLLTNSNPEIFFGSSDLSTDFTQCRELAPLPINAEFEDFFST